MAGPGDLYDLAAEWLVCCEAAVATAYGGAISYAYVSPGPPPLDCEELVVWAGGPAEANTAPLSPPLAPGFRDTVQGAVHLINLTCTVVRCVPGLNEHGRLPSVAELEDTARQTLGDVWAIWNETRQRHRGGTLFASNYARELFLEPAFPIPPDGGFAGWQVPIRVQLNGYRP